MAKKNAVDLDITPGTEEYQMPATADTLVGRASTDTLTNKTIDADGTGNVISNIENANIKAAAAIDATKMADGTVTSMEFQYINTLSSNAQTQLDAKLASTTPFTKAITVEDPTASENISMFFTDVAITVTQIVAVIAGSTSVSFDIEHGTSRATATGTGVIGTDEVADSTTTGNITTSFTDATIPANSFVWLSTSALSGTPTQLNVTVEYTID